MTSGCHAARARAWASWYKSLNSKLPSAASRPLQSCGPRGEGHTGPQQGVKSSALRLCDPGETLSHAVPWFPHRRDGGLGGGLSKDLRGVGQEAGSARERKKSKFRTSASYLCALGVLPEVCPHSLLLQQSVSLFLLCLPGKGGPLVHPSPPTALATQTHQTASVTSPLQKRPKKIIESVASFKGLTTVYLCRRVFLFGNWKDSRLVRTHLLDAIHTTKTRCF